MQKFFCIKVYANFANVFFCVPVLKTPLLWLLCSIFELGGITMYGHIDLANIELVGGAIFASLSSFLYGRVRHC